MDTPILVKSEREQGWALLDMLKKEHYPISAAFWKYVSDVNEWRLFLASPLVDQVGLIAAYKKLHPVLYRVSEGSADELSASNITLISPRAEQVAMLKKRYGEVKPSKSHIRRVSLGPEEAYVYSLGNDDGEAPSLTRSGQAH